MKQSGLKQSALELVPSRSRPAPESMEPASNVNDYFDDWLHSVGPAAIQRKTAAGRTEVHRVNRPLTQADLNRVIHSTVRESSDHRQWPLGAVEKFLAADVIRRKRRN